jgi:hypothetical protein
MMPITTAPEAILTDAKARSEFFSFYDFLVAQAERHCSAEAPVSYGRRRKKR